MDSESVLDIASSSFNERDKLLRSRSHGCSLGEGFLVAIVILFSIVLFPLVPFLAIRTVDEGRLGAILRFGRWTGKVHQSGLVWKLPLIDNLVVVDMRIHTYAMSKQTTLTRDSVTVITDALIYYQIHSLEKALFAIDDVHNAVKSLAQAALREAIGTFDLRAVVSDRDKLNNAIQKHMMQTTKKWGLEVSHVEIRDIQLPESMQRSMSSKAEALQEAEAKVIAAQGEKNAAILLKEAADEMMKSPGALQLRYLQTLATIAAEQNSTIIYPMPMDISPQMALSARDVIPLARK